MLNYIKKIILVLVACLLISSCAKKPEEPEEPYVEHKWVKIIDPVDYYMTYMTVDEKIGQLFIVAPEALDNSQSGKVTTVSSTMLQTLEKYPCGGVILFAKNIKTPQQITDFTSTLSTIGRVGLFISVDEEGGEVARIANNANFDVPTYSSMYAVGKSRNPDDARKVGIAIGTYLKKYGFNLDFAPDSDVYTNVYNYVIGYRAFSSNANVAARMVAACISGFHYAGVMTCIKHFPGHGNTSADSHAGYVTTYKDWDEMFNCEMQPFGAGIVAATDMVMVGHITTPNVTSDGLPASLSHQMVTGKLREQMRFSGVVITDAMNMGAISYYYDVDESTIMAINAGVDIILMPSNYEEAFNAVKQALIDGKITYARLNESVRRILTLKKKYGLLHIDEPA